MLGYIAALFLLYLMLIDRLDAYKNLAVSGATK